MAPMPIETAKSQYLNDLAIMSSTVWTGFNSPQSCIPSNSVPDLFNRGVPRDKVASI